MVRFLCFNIIITIPVTGLKRNIMNNNTGNPANSHGNENSSKRNRVSHKNGKHSVNLQKRGSTRFQFGLIIAMTIVYFALEASFESFQGNEMVYTELEPEVLEYYPDLKDVKVEVPEEKKIIKPKVKSTSFEIIENDKEVKPELEFIDKPKDDTSENLNPNTIEFKDPDPIIEEVIFIAVEDKPIFPGCENVGKEERLACFTEKMQNHIQRNFKYPEEAQELGIKGRVHVGFKIGKDGYISDIQLRGPHKLLEKEAARIISKLPKMTPGKQRGEPVRVPFSIPINFKLNL